MAYLILPLDHSLYALSRDTWRREPGQDYYRVAYWSRSPDREPEAFSYWEHEAFFRPATREAHHFKKFRVRSSQYQMNSGTFEVSATELTHDGSLFCDVVCRVIQGQPTPEVLTSGASDPYAALEWAHLSRVRAALNCADPKAT